MDVHDGKVTRGVQFGRAEEGGLRTVGDPVEMALRYDNQGADEMVFFDITASAHGRASMLDVIERAADQLLARQRPDGHWVFELEADATIPSEFVMLKRFFGIREISRGQR